MSNNIYCTYLTIYSGNKFPRRYIGSTSIKKIQQGYHGSVSSKKYGRLWKEELMENPQLFKTRILSTFPTKQEAILEEERLHRKYDVVRSPNYVNMTYANKGFFGYEMQGEVNPFYNKQHSEDTKEKMKEAWKTRVPDSEETRRKKSVGHKGIPVWNKGKTYKRGPNKSNKKGPEHGNRGKIPWNKGKKTGALSDEHKEKLSTSRVGKTTWNKGKKTPHSEETKRKISSAAKIMWNDPEKAQNIRKAIKDALSEPGIAQRHQEGLIKSWQGNNKRREAASKRMSERMRNGSEESKEAIETLKKSQPKGRETFKKRMKEDTEFRQTYVEIAKKKTEVLNERYKNDAEYRVMMDQKSIENIKEYNKIRAENIPIKFPLISPDGQIYSNIRSLNAFAKEQGLDSSGLYKLYSGKLNEVKGWKLLIA